MSLFYVLSMCWLGVAFLVAAIQGDVDAAAIIVLLMIANVLAAILVELHNANARARRGPGA